MAYVSMKNVKKLYTQGEDDVHALDGINVEIEKGEFIAILGPSGSGKSTLLNVLGGLDVPSSGEIYVDGRKINELNENQLAEYRRKTIGFVFQSFNLLPALIIEENIIMPILMEQKKVSMEFVKELMKVLEIDNLGKRMPSQISGGQQQRVAIARALANEPQMILADEPTILWKYGTWSVDSISTVCRNVFWECFFNTSNDVGSTESKKVNYKCN